MYSIASEALTILEHSISNQQPEIIMSQAADTPRVAFERYSSNNSIGSWKNDYLDREKYAVQLERLIANTPGPYVIGMTSSWGSGKTFFLTAWRESLLTRRCPRPCVYFNAWETDHAGDPLVALAAQISQQVKEQLGIEDALFDLIQKKASQIARKAPKALIGTLVGLINHYTGSEIPKDIAQLASDSFEVGTAAFLQAEKSRTDFKQFISSLAQKAISNSQLTEPDTINKSTNFPLLVIIDELDRCRPDYAITLLESIKHLFNEPGLVFLLAIDEKQILSVIEHTFGLHAEKDKDIRQEYLRKFIDIFWNLPSASKFNFAFSLLREKRIPAPNGWYVDNESFVAGSGLSDYWLNGVESFYSTLAASAALPTFASVELRGLVQAIEKFNVISRAYDLDWREAFCIFYAIIKMSSGSSKEQCLESITKKSYSVNRELHSVDVGSSNNVYIDLHRCIFEHIFNQSKIKLVIDLHTAETNNFVNQFIQEMKTNFNGNQLYTSVMNKLEFLDEIKTL